MEKSFREQFKRHQETLIEEGFFDGTVGGGVFRGNTYSHILVKEWNNLYPDIRDKVRMYFEKNKISFWSGTTITGNTLSSQVSCLNHLFLIRDDKNAVKEVIQALVGNRMSIETMIKVTSPKVEQYDPQYIAFEMISDKDRLNEGQLTRGKNCTSIDSFAIAQDKEGKKKMIVIEWKLEEDDSGNKAPTEDTSQNDKYIHSGQTRISRYDKLIRNSNALINKNMESFFNSSLFHLPFYELMRQTLWAENNKEDFKVDDYLHVTVIPKDNPMRSKNYRCIDNTKGIVSAWEKHLTKYGKDRYIDADPEQVVKALEHLDMYSDLVRYLQRRYYSLS